MVVTLLVTDGNNDNNDDDSLTNFKDNRYKKILGEEESYVSESHGFATRSCNRLICIDYQLV